VHHEAPRKCRKQYKLPSRKNRSVNARNKLNFEEIWVDVAQWVAERNYMQENSMDLLFCFFHNIKCYSKTLKNTLCKELSKSLHRNYQFHRRLPDDVVV